MIEEIPNKNYEELKVGVKSFRDERLLNPEKQYKPNTFGKVTLLLVFASIIGLMILSQVESVDLNTVKLFLGTLFIILFIIMLLLSIHYLMLPNTQSK